MGYINGIFMQQRLEKKEGLGFIRRVYLFPWNSETDYESEGLPLTPVMTDTEGGCYQVVGAVRVPFLGPSEKALGEIERAISGKAFWINGPVVPSDADLVINSTTIVHIEESGPLIPEASSRFKYAEQGRIERLRRHLIGRTGSGVINGEIKNGIAVYDTRKKKGLCSERGFSFAFRAFSGEEEVTEYLRLMGRMTAVARPFATHYGSIIRDSGFYKDENYEEMGIYYRDSNNFGKQADPLGSFYQGLGLAAEYPGGISFEALVATGKVISIGGIPMEQIPNRRLAEYILGSRDGFSADVWFLEDLLLKGAGWFRRTVYQVGAWEKLMLEDKEEAYPIYKHYVREREINQKSVGEIWIDEEIPPKVKRQLILAKLGLNVNPHIYIPLDEFFKNYWVVYRELESFWKTRVGFSTALFDEDHSGWSTPTVNFDMATERQRVREIMSGYAQKLREFERYRDDGRNYVVGYPFVFGEGEIDRVVAGRIAFYSKPSVIEDQKQEIDWRAELQQGTWPRGIGKERKKYISIEHRARPGRDLYSDLTSNSSSLVTEVVSGDVTDDDNLLLSAKQASLDYINGYYLKRAAAEIMGLGGFKTVVLEYYYHNGAISVVDFSAR